MNESYSSAVSTWLQSSPWDYFFTITNKKPRRDSIAFMRDIRDLATRGDQVAKIFIACEPHRYNHNLHAHGLLLVGKRPNSEGMYHGREVRYDFWNEFFHKFGRSRVEPIRSRGDVAHYCMKYVCKLTDGDNWSYTEF